MLGVLEGFTIIGVVVAVGYVLARVEILPSNAGVVLNRFAFFVALPNFSRADPRYRTAFHLRRSSRHVADFVLDAVTLR